MWNSWIKEFIYVWITDNTFKKVSINALKFSYWLDSLRTKVLAVVQNARLVLIKKKISPVNISYISDTDSYPCSLVSQFNAHDISNRSIIDSGKDAKQ